MSGRFQRVKWSAYFLFWHQTSVFQFFYALLEMNWPLQQPHQMVQGLQKLMLSDSFWPHTICGQSSQCILLQSHWETSRNKKTKLSVEAKEKGTHDKPNLQFLQCASRQSGCGLWQEDSVTENWGPATAMIPAAIMDTSKILARGNTSPSI